MSKYIRSAISVTVTCGVQTLPKQETSGTLLVVYVIQMKSFILSILYTNVEKLKLPCSQTNKLVAKDICFAMSATLLDLSRIELKQLATVSVSSVKGIHQYMPFLQ